MKFNIDHANFGTAKKRFEPQTLKYLVEDGQIEEAKAYVVKYFCIVSARSVYYYNAYLKSIESLTPYEVKETYIKACVQHISYKDKQKHVFSIQKWFFNDFNRIAEPIMTVNKPIAFVDDDIPFINLFPGFKYTERPATFKKKQLKNVQRMWNHINKIWCNNEPEIFSYVKKWLSHVIAGHKMRTCLYLKSPQGTGKSLVTEFIDNHVLGNKITHITKDTKCVNGGFNIELQGKILLVLEELPIEKQGEWRSIYNSMKNYITGTSIELEEKNKSKNRRENILSVILCSNHNAVKIEADDRRTLMLDISNEKIGDLSYFNKLCSKVNNDSVGECFFWDCVDTYNATKDFKEQIIPSTQNKKDVIVDNLHPLYNFIKFKFIKPKKDINMLFSSFYETYKEYCEEQPKRYEAETKIQVSKLLNNINIKTVSSTGNKTKIKITTDELIELFNKKNWIHELDEIDLNIENDEPVSESESDDGTTVEKDENPLSLTNLLKTGKDAYVKRTLEEEKKKEKKVSVKVEKKSDDDAIKNSLSFLMDDDF